MTQGTVLTMAFLLLFFLLNAHKQTYCCHLLSTCIHLCSYETNSWGINVGGHVTAVMHCPVGVDAERIERESMSVISLLLLQLSIYGLL